MIEGTANIEKKVWCSTILTIHSDEFRIYKEASVLYGEMLSTSIAESEASKES